MKKHLFFSVISLLQIILILSSCSSINSLTLSVQEPAPVTLPSNIKTVGIIDRSLPAEQNETMDKIDKILTAEGKNLDKDGAHAAVMSLMNELKINDQFSDVKIIENNNIKSAGVGVFPSALSWQTIERICIENDVDAIFALSFYDTDAQVDYKAVPIEIEGPMGIKIPMIEHHATIHTQIKTGFRIYDRVNNAIVDEFLVNEQIVSTGKGINPMEAVEAVLKRKEDVIQISNNIGHHYALRILPYHVRVSRNYYVRGSDNFEIAKRRAQTGDWDGAAELWEKEITNPKSKIAGRAYYNMAIINEINGDLNTAVEWASKSYTDYNNKKALQYVHVLQDRIEENKRLQQQME